MRQHCVSGERAGQPVLAMIKKYLPWLIALLYFISPYDLVPDFVAGPGWLDDLAVIAVILWWVSRLKTASQAASASSAHAGKEQSAPGPEEAPEEDPYKILDVQPGASKEEIKAAYKRLAAQYHPDKVQHLGKEFQELAHQKFVAIQKAYDALMK
ncbi:MAG: DnaJ domain-containing protein [Desulfobacterales bacterium]|nr:MAG: DnaJ domain-containing protein [Desulfobacterales bacterium]